MRRLLKSLFRYTVITAPLAVTYTFTFTPNGATSSNYTYTVMTVSTVKVYNKQQYLTHACTLSAVSNQTGTSLQVSILLKGNW